LSWSGIVSPLSPLGRDVAALGDREGYSLLSVFLYLSSVSPQSHDPQVPLSPLGRDVAALGDSEGYSLLSVFLYIASVSPQPRPSASVSLDAASIPLSDTRVRIDPKDPRRPSDQERDQRSFPFQHEQRHIEQARDLRQRSTTPERVLWSRLKASRLGGFKFRRQHPIGPYVADFYCHEAQLVVEIDGSVHDTQQERDQRRDTYLSARGLRVARFTASWLARDESAVLGRILQLCRERSSEAR
jgi:very-short-patch-repair endonuclease